MMKVFTEIFAPYLRRQNGDSYGKTDSERIVEIVSEGLVKAGSTFLPDKIAAYRRAIDQEINSQAKWTLETILENALVAEKNQSPFMR